VTSLRSLRVALALALASAVPLVACGPRGGSPAVQPGDDPPDPVLPDDPAPDEAPPQEGPVTQIATPQELTFPEEAFRATQPPPAAPRPFQLPTMKPFTLRSGVQVYLVEQHTLPIVSLDLVFDGGSVTDPVGKEGLASMCMSMLSEGTTALDKIAYAEALADVAASVGSYAGGDQQGVSMSSLTAHLDTVFPIFVDTLLRPGFRQADFDRMVQRRRDSLRQAKASASSIAGRVNGTVLYGEGHPFGRNVTEASLAAITLDDCRAYHARWLKPGGARLFVVGDLTEAQLRQLFEADAVAAWKGKAAKLAKLPAPKTPAGRIFFVDVPGAKQSEVSVQHFGPPRAAKDFFETSIMGAVLGGGFSSRINMNLREDKGYSYGARAGFGYSRYYGTFSGSSSVVSNATYQSLLELQKEVTALHGGAAPATAEELTREKTGAVLSLPGRFATASASLGAFRSLVYFGLPLDYYGSYVDKVGAVTAAQVTAAARKHLKPTEAVYLVVGDGSVPVIYRDGTEDKPLLDGGRPLTLREALVKLADDGTLGKGGLVELDADGRRVKR
jgi:predicted Zn-dependent peptidase